MLLRLFMHSPDASSGTDHRGMAGDADMEPCGSGAHAMQPMNDGDDGGNSMPRQRSASLAESYMPSRLSQGGAAPCRGSAVPR